MTTRFVAQPFADINKPAMRWAVYDFATKPSKRVPATECRQYKAALELAARMNHNHTNKENTTL